MGDIENKSINNMCAYVCVLWQPDLNVQNVKVVMCILEETRP